MGSTVPFPGGNRIPRASPQSQYRFGYPERWSYPREQVRMQAGFSRRRRSQSLGRRGPVPSLLLRSSCPTAGALRTSRKSLPTPGPPEGAADRPLQSGSHSNPGMPTDIRRRRCSPSNRRNCRPPAAFEQKRRSHPFPKRSSPGRGAERGRGEEQGN